MTAQAVRRRRVFFLSGFDPKGASYYHRLYQEGAATQQQVSGHVYEVSAREKTDDGHVQRWRMRWQGDVPAAPEAGGTATVNSTLEFLAWDDLVRSYWPRGVLAVAWGSVLAGLAVLSTGWGLVRVWRQSRRTLIALVYPLLLWMGALLAGLLLGALAFSAVSSLGQARPWAAPGAWAAAAAACLACWWAALRLEQKLHTSWLLRIFRIADLWSHEKLPGLNQRLDAMAARVEAALRASDEDEEILVVGYSVGSMLGVSVLARVLRRCADDASLTRRLSFLTLGQCIPLLALMPQARRFRDDLGTLAAATDLCWVDYSSPTDWGSFAMVDPLEICRIASPMGQGMAPVMRSPRFHTLFDTADYLRLRKNKRQLHLQYLRSAPRRGDYDYFLMTAGPWRLCQAPGQGRSI